MKSGRTLEKAVAGKTAIDGEGISRKERGNFYWGFGGKMKFGWGSKQIGAIAGPAKVGLENKWERKLFLGLGN